MLFDWWTASHQDPSYSLAAILSLVDHCNAVNLHEFEQNGSKKQAELVILQLLELERWPEGDIMTPPRLPGRRARLRGYHDDMEDLFFFEFNSSHEPEGRQREIWERRRWARSKAAQSAYCQQMAWQLLQEHEASELRTQMPDEGQDNGGVPCLCTDSVPTEIIESNFARVFGAEKHQQTDPKIRGAIIEGCPWLPPVSERDLPYYLWDVKNGKTVESSTLECHPEYTAISHTWGRWATGQTVHVKGVTEWKIPQNTRFPVEEIPEILRRGRFDTPYVWLDLCCIPQEPGSAIGASEIARQAQIFRNAQVVVAWLNDVDDFQVLVDIVKWELLQLLQLRTGPKQKTRDALVAETWQRVAGKRTGLLGGRRSGDYLLKGMTLNPWFTSLWTLQEVAMRPDMWVSAKDWSMLSVDGITALTVSGLIAICQLFEGQEDDSYLSDFDDHSSIGRIEIEIWQFESSLSKLLTLDQVTLLVLGDCRQCTGRRAEAIMSALGATQWYEKMIQEVPPGNETQLRDRLEEDLILGKYPISFVREVSRTMPGSFFGSYLKEDSIIAGERNGTSASHAHGSMLPFSSSPALFLTGNMFRTESIRFFSEAHCTLRTWEVRASGQVYIHEACVVSSSVEGLGQCSMQDPRIMAVKTMPAMSIEEHGASLSTAFQSRHGGKGITYCGDPSCFDLNLWISRQPTCTHAILIEFRRWNEEGLVDYGMGCFGIIIQERPPGKLMKIANFHCIDLDSVVDLSEVKKVDWLVD